MCCGFELGSVMAVRGGRPSPYVLYCASDLGDQLGSFLCANISYLRTALAAQLFHNNARRLLYRPLYDISHCSFTSLVVTLACWLENFASSSLNFATEAELPRKNCARRSALMTKDDVKKSMITQQAAVLDATGMR